ncbi:MAG: V-type ATP synthase subunit F [Nanoarchaeota archaeon]
MSRIFVYGTPEFYIGFILAGVRDVVDAGSDPYLDIQEILRNPDAGILIIDESITEKLNERERGELEDNVKPVVFVLSEKETQESFRRLVKKSIGIDLMKNR